MSDHIDPIVVQYYRDGKIDIKGQQSIDAVQAYCPKCSRIQGAQLTAFRRKMKKYLVLNK